MERPELLFWEGLMNRQENAECFSQRAAAEREMSERALNERVAAAHKEMAWRYEELAFQFTRKSPPLRIVKNESQAVQ